MATKTLKEALEIITAKEENGKLKINQFSKKNFEMFLTACANDIDFKSDIVHSVKGEITEREALPVTTMFREWLKKVVEEAGVDKAESEKILTSDFEIPAVKGLYDFFVAAMYDYMKAGNYFALPDKEDFKGKIYTKKQQKTVTTKTAKNPKTGETLGTFESTKEEHYTLGVKGACPKWLVSRKKIY